MSSSPARFGRYELLVRLATSGASSVYRARSPGSQRLLALKVLSEGATRDEAQLGAFLDEARVAAGVHVPSVARLLDHGDVDGTPYMAFEWIDGVSLEDTLNGLLKRAAHFPVDQAARLFGQLADVLHAVHTAKDAGGQPLELVHGDVCPANVLVDAEGDPHLVDFGAARSSLRRMPPGEESRVTSLGYRAPEHLDGLTGPKSDIFSLGVCLYDCLSGLRLFVRPTVEETVEAIRKFDGMPSLRRLRPEVPEALEEVVSELLARDPDRRPATMLEARKHIYGALTAALLSGPDLDEATGTLVTSMFPDRFARAGRDSSPSRPSLPSDDELRAKDRTHRRKQRYAVVAVLAATGAVVGLFLATRP